MRVMLAHFEDQFFVDLASKLLTQGVEISHIITYHCYQQLKENPKFERVEILSAENFEYHHLIHCLNRDNPEALDGDVLERLAECEIIFLSISDRLSYFPISVQERKKLYLELVLYWYTFLKNQQIEAIVFPVTPHMGWDVVLYYTARELGVKTLYLQRTSINNRLFLKEDYREIIKVPFNFLAGASRDELINFIGPELIGEIHQSNPWMIRSKIINESVLIQKTNPINKLQFLLKKFKSIVQAPDFKQQLRTLLRKAIKGLGRPGHASPLFYNNIRSKLFKRLLFITNNSRIRARYRFYAKHASAVNYDSQFIIFGMHYQPERTTCPEGGVFENQFLAIKLLSRAVPEDWTIYVKEHPRQFKSFDLTKRHYTLIADYRKILALNNVKFVKLKEDTKKLIDNAVLVATITGSMGWEALLKHKPCLVFSNPWYSACNSCHAVKTLDDCQRAIAAIQSTSAADVEIDLLKMLAYQKESYIISSNNYRYTSKTNISHQTLVTNLAERVIQHLDKKIEEALKS